MIKNTCDSILKTNLQILSIFRPVFLKVRHLALKKEFEIFGVEKPLNSFTTFRHYSGANFVEIVRCATEVA